MNSKMRSCLTLLLVAAPLLGSFAGCTQADNPTPVAAPPPPPPTEVELKVPKGADGKAYGSGSAYQKAMERANKQGAQ